MLFFLLCLYFLFLHQSCLQQFIWNIKCFHLSIYMFIWAGKLLKSNMQRQTNLKHLMPQTVNTEFKKGGNHRGRTTDMTTHQQAETLLQPLWSVSMNKATSLLSSIKLSPRSDSYNATVWGLKSIAEDARFFFWILLPFFVDLNLSKLERLNSCFTAHLCFLFRPLQTPLNMAVMCHICLLSSSLSWVVTVSIGFDSWKEPEQKQQEMCPMSSIYRSLFRDGS